MVKLIKPNGGEEISGNYLIEFIASHPNAGNLLNASIWYSSSPYEYENLIIENLNLLDPVNCTDSDHDWLTDNNCSYLWN